MKCMDEVKMNSRCNREYDRAGTYGGKGASQDGEVKV